MMPTWTGVCSWRRRGRGGGGVAGGKAIQQNPPLVNVPQSLKTRVLVVSQFRKSHLSLLCSGGGGRMCRGGRSDHTVTCSFPSFEQPFRFVTLCRLRSSGRVIKRDIIRRHSGTFTAPSSPTSTTSG